jgi:hypothetical protein
MNTTRLYLLIMKQEANGFKQKSFYPQFGVDAIEKLVLSISDEEVIITLFSKRPWKEPTLMDLQ